jgi:hypothetical protein
VTAYSAFSGAIFTHAGTPGEVQGAEQDTEPGIGRQLAPSHQMTFRACVFMNRSRCAGGPDHGSVKRRRNAPAVRTLQDMS